MQWAMFNTKLFRNKHEYPRSASYYKLRSVHDGSMLLIWCSSGETFVGILASLTVPKWAVRDQLDMIASRMDADHSDFWVDEYFLNDSDSDDDDM
ncbi:hypothetical protein TetV_639 [Tetraselmis virus 1]|uniref:Uncharacterized protein n=1 Tax=Tetraselmis virus 1 TaxID=2060617 RepID=A0A2P0VPA2_9VIRU|nr:hypothetical protein QJ968_gp415 [Tetraselmis virus 1]AUF82721.1 hypothetical protein TetV_639 [Tetraselmis virus 1]